MANTLTNVLPVLTAAAQVVSREACGMLRAIDLHGDANMASIGQTINVPKCPTIATTTWTPSLAPTLTNRTITGTQLTLSACANVEWHISSEHQRGMDSGNSTALADFQRQSAQAMRSNANTIDAYVWGLAYLGAARATGTAATTPFASSTSDVAACAKLLNQLGAPMDGRSLVLDPAGYANLQTQFNNPLIAMQQVLNEWDSGDMPKIGGIQPRLSANIISVASGTGTAGALVNLTAGYAAGTQTIVCDTQSAAGYLPGDIVKIGTGTVDRYVLSSTTASATNIYLNAPGLRVAVANNDVIVKSAASTRNIALTRDSIVVAVRPPAQTESSGNFEHTVVQDAVSGIPFGITKIMGDGCVFYGCRAVYGAVVLEGRHIAVLMG